MKKLILISSLVVVSQLTFAHGMDKDHFRPHEPPSVEQRVERMTRALSLTDEQASQITASLTSLKPQREALMEQMKSLRDLEKQAIDAVLTDEQKQKLEDRQHRRMRDI